MDDPAVVDAVAAAERALLATPEGRSDPYPHYRTLRAHAPVHRSPVANGWLLSRYDDCHAVLRDPRFLRGYAESMDYRSSDWRHRPALAAGERSMLNMDGPEHMRLRKLVVRSFTPRTVERLRPRIEQFVDELLDLLAQKGGGDLMSELAFPLPVRVIGELLGVPEEDQPPFRQRIQALTAIFEVSATRDMLDDADVAQLESDAYFAELIDHKRSHPGDDLLSTLLTGEEGDRLTAAELGTLALLLFAAGFETTTNLIGNAMVGLLAHPDQMALLRASPEYFAGLPDELLRYDGTVQITARLATEAVEVGGTVIPAGEPVFPLVGAANRDPARFEHPEELDVTRSDVRPLTFGGGVHFCLGAALARAETEIVFRKVLERFAHIELAGEAPFRDRLTLRGPVEVPLRLEEAARATHPDAAATPSRSPARPPRSPEPAAPAGATPGSVAVRPGEALPLRPGGGDERAWQAAFRERLEAAPPANVDVAGVAALLGRVPLFSGCTAEELADLAATTYPLAFDTGDVLCAEGAASPECYVIAEGEASVLVEGAEIATVGADDVVGERGVLLQARRNATVVARSHLVTYAISRERLVRLAHSSPSVRHGMEAALQRRYGEHTDLTAGPPPPAS